MNRQEELASIILGQIRAADPVALMAWGARNYVCLNEEKQERGYVLGGVMFNVSGFKVPKGKVIVYLMASDTYTVRVISINGAEVTEVEEEDDVYCDNLMSVIDGIIER